MRRSRPRLGWSTAITAPCATGSGSVRPTSSGSIRAPGDHGSGYVSDAFTRRSAHRIVGNRERWRHMLRPSHPIRWAWNTWERRRRETADRLTQKECAHLAVLRLRRPSEASRAVEFLAKAAGV